MQYDSAVNRGRSDARCDVGGHEGTMQTAAASHGRTHPARPPPERPLEESAGRRWHQGGGGGLAFNRDRVSILPDEDSGDGRCWPHGKASDLCT